MQPMAATRSANATTSGVMPGTSAITMTAGPSPRRKTRRSFRWWAKVSAV